MNPTLSDILWYAFIGGMFFMMMRRGCCCGGHHHKKAEVETENNQPEITKRNLISTNLQPVLARLRFVSPSRRWHRASVEEYYANQIYG